MQSLWVIVVNLIIYLIYRNGIKIDTIRLYYFY